MNRGKEEKTTAQDSQKKPLCIEIAVVNLRENGLGSHGTRPHEM